MTESKLLLLISGLIQLALYLELVAALTCFFASIRLHEPPRWKVSFLGIAVVSFLLTGMLSEATHHGMWELLASTLWQITLLLLLLTETVVLILGARAMIHTLRTTPFEKAIKDSLDQLSVGFCCCESDGRPFLVNHEMQKISRALTGGPLRSGEVFLEAAASHNLKETADLPLSGEGAILASSGGQVFRITKKPWESDGGAGGKYVLSADDVTELYLLNARLREQNRRLAEMNRSLKEYNKLAGELVRDQEILTAKINVHDNMGRLLLSAKRSASEPQDLNTRRALLREWQQNLRLLAVSPSSDQSAGRLEELTEAAASIGVQIHLTGELPAEGTSGMDLLGLALHECITNAVSHADSRCLYVTGTADEHCYTLTFTNDGTPPEAPAEEGGGLSMLRGKLRQAGGDMKIQWLPAFCLTVTIRREPNE